MYTNVQAIRIINRKRSMKKKLSKIFKDCTCILEVQFLFEHSFVSINWIFIDRVLGNNNGSFLLIVTYVPFDCPGSHLNTPKKYRFSTVHAILHQIVLNARNVLNNPLKTKMILWRHRFDQTSNIIFYYRAEILTIIALLFWSKGQY